MSWFSDISLNPVYFESDINNAVCSLLSNKILSKYGELHRCKLNLISVKDIKDVLREQNFVNVSSMSYFTVDTLISDGCIYVNPTIDSVFFYTGTEAVILFGTLEAIEKYKNHFFSFKLEKENQCHLVCKSNNDYFLRPIEHSAQPLIRDNYSKDVCAGVDEIIADFNSDVPSGRLVVIRGTPGSGKTYLVRGLLKELPPSFSFVFIPSYSVKGILEGNFLDFIMNQQMGRSVTFFIEDGDEAVRSRNGSNNSLVSAILNLTSGLISETFDFRVIITTNEELDNIDDAIKRDGRLSYLLTVDKLSEEQATEVYRRLTGDPNAHYTGNPVLSDIYFAANAKKGKQNIAEKKVARIGF